MLAATSSISNINTTMTLYGTGVYYLNPLSLGNGAVLTLSGSATDSFVFNISSTFMLTGGKILLTGGLTAANVLFNFTGTNDVTLSNGSGASELHGIILALNARVQVSSMVIGEIIGGKDISLLAGADVRNTVALTPETGGSVTLLALGVIGLGVLRLLHFARANLAVNRLVAARSR
jgi:choice-of-anchor A domain-containing protein